MGGFASIKFPLTTLTLKNVKFEWSNACERSFQILKGSFTTTLVLTLAEVTKGLMEYFNASLLGSGCVLM